MTDIPAHVAAFEHGTLRLWSFDGQSETGRALVDAMAAEPRNAGPVLEALGAERVDPYWVDLLRLSDIADLGLTGYLRQGYDIPRDQLDALHLAPTGDHVLIVPSRAFADREQTLAPAADLTPLAAIELHEDVGHLRPMAPVETARPEPAASERPETPPGPPAGRGLRPGAILVLLLIAAAFIWMVAR